MNTCDIPPMATNHSELEAVGRALAQREAALTASEAENRRLRAQLEHDQKAFQRIVEITKRLASKLDSSVADGPVLDLRNKTVRQAVIATIPEVSRSSTGFTSGHLIDFWKKLPSVQAPGFDLEKNNPNVSACLKKLKEEGRIMRIEEASGSRPALYQLREESSK